MKIPVSPRTYHFIKFIQASPGSTGREIVEYLNDVLDVPDSKKYRHAFQPQYDNCGRYIGFVSVRTRSLDTGRYGHLLSPYYSNMLTDGNRTKDRSWVRRFKVDGVYRYMLTIKGIAHSEALQLAMSKDRRR